MTRLLTLLLAAALGAACAKPADCDAVVAHTAELMTKERLLQFPEGAAPDKAQLEKVQGEMLLAARNDLMQECKAKKWTKREEKCILAAKNLEALGNCEVPK